MSPNNHPTTRLAHLYTAYCEHHQTKEFIDGVLEHYTEAALVRLGSSRCVTSRRGAALALGFVGSFQANSTLGRLLVDDDKQVAILAESSIKSVWTRGGTLQERQELCRMMQEISNGDYAEAVRLGNNLLERTPHFAEVRNQRAIALFALQQYEDAVRDCSIVLEDNPFHFGAAVGMGHAYLQLGEYGIALFAFHHALKINPRLTQVEKQIAMIEARMISE
ncbi:MAG: tetratricopeptide repeat protein [Thermoguttaceae bacterium]